MIWSRVAAVGLFCLGLFCLAQARPGPDSNYNISVSAGGGSFSLTYQASAGLATTGVATLDYGTLSYGSGCNAIVINVAWYNSLSTDTVTAVAVGASSASHLTGTFVSDHSSGPSTDMWQFNSPTGTSADIKVTYSTGPTYNSAVSVYCLVTGTTTVSATNVGNGSPASAAITVPAGGAAVANALDTNGHTITYTNATADSTNIGGGIYNVWGHTTSTGSLTITATPSISDSTALSVAAWGP